MTMNLSHKTAVLGLALLLGAGTAGIAGAHGIQGGAQGQGEGSMMQNGPMIGGLELTDEQRQRLRGHRQAIDSPGDR